MRPMMAIATAAETEFMCLSYTVLLIECAHFWRWNILATSPQWAPYRGAGSRGVHQDPTELWFKVDIARNGQKVSKGVVTRQVLTLRQGRPLAWRDEVPI